MEYEFISLLFAWLPFILVVGVFVWVLIRVRGIERRRAHFDAESLIEQKKQTVILERIASLLEQKNTNG